LPAKKRETALPPRDWGTRGQYLLWGYAGPDIGLFVGGGYAFSRYGFRKLPFAYRHRIRTGFATGPTAFRVEYAGEFHRENSGVTTLVEARASGIEVIRFHGFGNDTRAPGSDEFYRVTQQQYRLAPSLMVPLTPRLFLKFGPELTYVSTDRRPGRFLATINPYGVGQFGELGARASLAFDSRDHPLAPTRGVRLEAGGAVHPAWWDVQETFGEAWGEATMALTARMPLAPTLALRAGGRKLWGAYPYFEAAFIGDRNTVRLGREERYAGDASAYGSAELRLRLTRMTVVLPADFGIFGLADAGRVFLAGESSDTWHTAFGGGVWLGFLSRANTVSAALASSRERTRLYLQAGFGF
jgi:outer membrane protein assembly factor BamA